MKIENHQKTKIVATLGPACSSVEMLTKLIQEGVDVFRLNFSHGSQEEHKKTIDKILKLRKKYNVHISILADLQGPKLRVGKIKNNKLELKAGDEITFVNKECIGTMSKIYMSYSRFAKDVSVGEKVLVDDGKLMLEVAATDKKSKVKLKVLYGGTLSSNKGVNLPQTKISLPCLTRKDLNDLKFVLTQPVNWIALSFVRSADDIKDLKKRIKKAGKLMKVIAKVEKPEAVKKISSIIKASDAIMVARGDLGVEVPMEQVPSIQKNIIQRCIQKGKPVIVATQMMDSMVTNINPTRAEVTDVANAVIDGTDAVMLSAETSVGNHPHLVVRAMNKIITEAEKHYENSSKRPKPNPKSETFLSDIMCYNAARVAMVTGAKGIASLTVSGYTAFKISSYRPNCSVFTFSSSYDMLATLNLVWGVRCYHYDKFTTTDGTIEDVVEILKKDRKLRKGDKLINTGSMPIQKRFRTNMMKVTIIE